MTRPDTSPDPTLSDDAATVLTFWFGAPDDPDHGTIRKAWFMKSDAFDAEVTARFGALTEAARRGDLDAWTTTPRGTLALVLLLDQMPRNIHRGSLEAFATDARALEVATQALRDGYDRALSPVEQMFLFMPFQHSEDLVDQERSLALYARLDLPDVQRFVHRHHEIIARFGRFPHRNAVLGRETTPEEAAFLLEPDSSF